MKSLLHHGNRHSCLHWPGAALTLLVVVGLLCCYGDQPHGRCGTVLVLIWALTVMEFWMIVIGHPNGRSHHNNTLLDTQYHNTVITMS